MQKAILARDYVKQPSSGFPKTRVFTLDCSRADPR